MTGHRSMIGLDFGADSIKLVRAERQRGGRVVFTHAALLRLPTDKIDTLPMVQRWLESLHLPGTPCVVALAGRSIILKAFEMERGDPRTPAQAAGLEIQKLRKLTSEEIVFDVMEITPAPNGTRQVLLFVVRPAILDAALAPPASLGLEVLDVVPASVALFNLVNQIPADRPQGSFALIDIGHANTEISIGTAGGLRFSRSFDIGTQQFAAALAEDEQLTPAQAHERLRGTAAILESTSPALAKVIKAWRQETLLSLETYRDRFPGPVGKVDEWRLTGGGALLSGLAAGLEQWSSLPAKPFPLLPLPGDDAGAPVFALAAGLALTGVGSEGSHVSLAPAPLKQRQALRRRRLQLVTAGGVLLAALLTFATSRYLEQKDDREQAAEAERQATAHVQMQERLSRLQLDNAALVDTLRPVYQSLGVRVALMDIIRAVSEARKGNDWCVSIATARPAASNALESAIMPGRTNVPGAAQLFLVRGYTPDPDFYSVRAMIDALHRNSRIINADLMDASALELSDPLASHWATLQAIPFALTLQTWPPRSMALPDPGSLAAPPPASMEGVRQTIREQEALTRSLLATWTTLVTRYATFKTKGDLFNLPPQSDVALIDFRVALEETRLHWMNEARATGVKLPPDLGLGDAALKDKEIRTLLFQLGAVNKWLDIAMSCRITAVTGITPLDPLPVSVAGRTVMEQYPLQIAFKGRLPAVMSMLEELGRETHFMVVRSALLLRPDSRDPASLDVTLELAALDFPEPPGTPTPSQNARLP